MLLRIKDPEAVHHYIEKWHGGQRHLLLPVPGRDVKHRLVRTSRKSRGQRVFFQQAFRRNNAARDQLSLVQKFYPHAGSHDAARYIHDMYRDARHVNSVSRPRRAPGPASR